MVKSLSDTALIDHYISSLEEKYVAELISRYSTLVFGTCMKYLKHQEDSKDLSIEVFEKVIQKIKTHPIEHFKSWLYRLTVNECLMKLRKKEEKIIPLDAIVMENRGDMHLTDEDKEIKLVLLEKCLETLKEEQRETISLFYLKEMSYQQVAEKTQYALKKVKSYIQNGKRNLKICMDKNE